MAIHFAGGTDRLQYGSSGWNHTTGCFAFWMKTTQTTANAVPLSVWTGSSRTGFGFIINNTLNKLLVQGYNAASTSINMTGTHTINDGNWHHVAFNWNTANGAANTSYVDGIQDATANSSSAWPIASTSVPLTMGDNNDAFWPSYVGDLAEVAAWFDRNLTVDEIVALSKGFSPRLIYPPNLAVPSGLVFYAPLVRDHQTVLDSAGAFAPVGTTVSDHPRML